MYYEYNPNPVSRRVGDCAVRAVAKALDTDWETAYTLLVTNGFLMGDMPSSDRMGRFTSRDASEMSRKLREMMEEAPDESVKREIERLADRMETM